MKITCALSDYNFASNPGSLGVILYGQMFELGSAVRQLHRSGLDSASAELLLSRKRAELEDLMNQARHGKRRGDDYVS